MKRPILANKYTKRIAILLLEEKSVTATVELLESDSLRLFNDLILLNQLLGVYMRNSKNEDEVLLIDKWRNGFNQDLDFFPKRLANLNGKTLKSTSFDFPPYNYPIKDGNGNVMGWDGAEYRVTKMIADAMNFKFEINTPSDGGLWGGLGEFFSMVIEIIRYDFKSIHH